jgi:hypothetical protein
MLNSIKAMWSRRSYVAGATIFSCYVLLVIFSLNALCLNVTQINLELGRTSTGFCSAFSTGVLGWLGLKVSGLSPAEYKRTIGTVLTLQMTLVSLYLVVVPILSLFQYRQKLAQQQSLRREPVRTEGVEDLKVMLKAYERGERITVFSGDFSWLGGTSDESRNLREKICALADADKVVLVSYKSEADIRTGLKNEALFARLRRAFVIAPAARLKCSLIEYSGSNATFLFKDRGGEFGQDSFVVIARAADETRELIGALRELIKNVEASGQRIP